jgi:uncharacterized protein (TIGR03437 family)
VQGLYQVNLQVPQSAPSGSVPVQLTVGSVKSQSGATLAIR